MVSCPFRFENLQQQQKTDYRRHPDSGSAFTSKMRNFTFNVMP